MTCLISQLTPSFSARPPRNEICQEDVWSAGPLRPLTTTQAQRPWPLTEPPSPTSQPPGPGQGTSRKVRAGKAERGGEMVRSPSSLARGQWRSGGGAGRDGLTHRVQLPLEYDEGHETNNDKHRAEAQVGKEVAREITWGGAATDRENRMNEKQ